MKIVLSESYAENIFTYNERLRGLLENQINLGEIEFVMIIF